MSRRAVVTSAAPPPAGTYWEASWGCEFTAHQFEQGEGLFQREHLFAASPIG
jgi:hypothetical protein